MKAPSTPHRSVPSAKRATGTSLSPRTLGIGALLVIAMTTGCSTAARREIEAERVQAHTAPLELRAPKGAPNAYIGTEGSVTIGTTQIPTNDRQRAAALAYRQASLEVVDLTLRQASQLTKFAIPRALFGMVTHGPDKAGDALEKDANRIPHSPEFCALLDNMRQKQVAMVSQVAALRPYANLTPEDIDDCRSDRPYRSPL